MQLIAIVIACLLAAICFCGCGSPQPEPEPLPYWATFFEAGEFEQFKAEVRRQLDLKERPYTFDVADGTVIYDDRPEMKIGLHNLAQYCFHKRQEDWSDEIDGFFVRVEKLADKSKKEPSSQEARKLFRIRLQPLDIDYSDEMVYYPVCEGFQTMLVLNEDEQLTFVGKTRLKNWNISTDEAYKIAMENLAQDPKPTINEYKYEDSTSIFGISGESLMTTTHLLHMDTLIDINKQFGFVAIVPQSENVIVIPLENASSLNKIGGLKAIAQKQFVEGPSSISNEVFWVRGSVWTILDIEKKGDSWVVGGPKKFFDEVIDKLQAK